ncbi:hypothetical protein SH203_02839 [Brevundimonas sp. SH203]|uniref:hypothetical protein n=1 Tax=Brevundimonas sp. SH203 TaxID=345167 RepID=UPI0009C8E89B|nr:hypothetical protein [Brevundimonas sp. SH203]GAW42423.1 hypothetical protein SH203_02839 [Brevundimonas sp. SH203]
MTLPATAAKAVALQYQAADGGWVTVAECDVGAILRTRRLASPPGQAITARRWRVIKKTAEDLAGVFRLSGLRAFRETATLSAHKRWTFDFDAGEQRYGLIATDGNVEVYRRGVRVASIPSPYSHETTTQVRRTQSRDTLIGFHVDVAPYRFARQGGHTEWDSRVQPLKNVPIFDYTGQRAGGVNEVQTLTFVDYEGGDTFNITLEGETTSSIAYSASGATLAASVAAALQSLSNVGAGGVSVAAPSGATLHVTFIGANRADDLGEMAPTTLQSEKGRVRVATLVQGKAGGEPVISDARGWPAVGVFFGSRLWMGGLKSRTQTLLSSRLGFFFDFQTTGAATADKGIDVDLDTDESTDIMALFPGRHLQVFSQSQEFFCPAIPIVPPAPFPPSSKAGLEPGTPILEMDSNAVFVQAGGQTISRTLYSAADEEKYIVDPLSSFASHLMAGDNGKIVAGGMRRHRSTDLPNLGLFIRADGGGVAMTALLSQEVLGFAPWTTDGAFTEAGGEMAGDLYVCTRRQSGGVESHRLERLDEGRMLDASVLVEGPCAVVTGLQHLEGRTVVAYVDGGDAGDVVVSGAKAVLPYPALRSAEVGLLFTPRGCTLPIVLERDPRAAPSMHARTGEIAFRLGPTANLHAGMAGKRLWPVPLKRRGGHGRQGALLDHGPGEDAFEGWTRLYPVPGFQDDAQIAWEQRRPGPLEIREVVGDVQS